MSFPLALVGGEYVDYCSSERYSLYVLAVINRHFSVTADLRICKIEHTLDLRYLRGAISAV